MGKNQVVNYHCSDVLLIKFPLTDLSQDKPRPALVLLDIRDNDFLLARITSRKARIRHDFSLLDWQFADLLIPSLARLHKMTSLDKSRILEYIGKLSEKYQERVRLHLKEMWDI